MMKKLNLQYAIVFMISLLLFVSCMGEGTNKQTGPAVGVVRFDNKINENVLDVGENETFYAYKMFANTIPGACFHIYYEIDFDLPENSFESVEANGYWTVTIIDLLELDRWEMANSIGDTSKILTDEMAIIEPLMGKEFAYVKGMGFLISTLEIPTEQKMYWQLSYDLQNYLKEEGGQRYYDVFLRSTVRIQSTKTIMNQGVINAYYMKDFLERIAMEEKNLGHASFKLRFNYVSAINDEELTWDHQESADILINDILPVD